MKLSSRLVAEVLIGIENNNGLGTSLSASASHVVTETTGTTDNVLAVDLKWRSGDKRSSPSDDNNLAHDAHLLKSARHLTIDLILQGLHVVIGLALRNLLARLYGNAEVITSVGGGGALCVARVDRDGNLCLLHDLRLEVASGNREGGALGNRCPLGKKSRRAGEGGEARGHADGASSGGHFDSLWNDDGKWTGGVSRVLEQTDKNRRTTLQERKTGWRFGYQ